MISENELTPRLLEARNHIWSDMIDQLNPIVDYMLHHDDQASFSSNFRMADFANFGWKALRSKATQPQERQELGDYWLEILDKLDQAQTEELLIDHPIYMCLERWMENTDNHGSPTPTVQLYQQLSEISETYSIGMPYQSSRSFSRQLSQLKSNLLQYYKIEVTKPQNRITYAFWPIQELEVSGNGDGKFDEDDIMDEISDFETGEVSGWDI